MIKSFKDKKAEKIFNQQKSKKLPEQIYIRALNKLIILDNAITENNSMIPPSNYFEHLTSLRLSKYFGNSERFWLNLQNDIDLIKQPENDRILKAFTTPFIPLFQGEFI